MPFYRRSSVTVLAAVVVCLTNAVTHAQPLIRFRSPVSVGVEPQIVKTVETAREHIREGQWEQAIPILQELIETNGDSMVPLEAGRFGSVADFCHLLISSLPPAGLTEYRNRMDGQASEWLADGRERLDEVPLRRVVDRAFNSSFGDEALWLLGELAFEQGRFAQARQHWQLLAPANPTPPEVTEGDEPRLYLTYLDSDIPLAEVLARLVLCSIFEGDLRRAEVEAAAFRELHPDADGTLAGSEGLLADLLDRQLEQSRQWPASQTSAPQNPTFAGRPDRGHIPTQDPIINGVAWRTAPIVRSHLKGPAGRNDTLTLFPLVYDGTVFVANAGSIYAFNLDTGRPMWPIDGADNGEIMTSLLNGPVMADLPSSGVPWYTLSISGGRLYSRMGLPFTRRSKHEGSSFTELVGLDLDREGELSFRVTPDSLDSQAESPEATHWSFEGTPVVANGRVYAAARRGTPEDETVVACFDAETSRLIWQRRVCVSLRNIPDHYNVVGHHLMTLGDGRLFIKTGTGAVAALDAETGRVLWVVTWPIERDATYDQESSPQRHGLTPGLYHRGVLYTVTRSRELMALDATTGQPFWERRMPDRILHLLGIVDGRLILSGKALWAVDIHSGDDAWPTQPEVGFTNPDGFGYGRGALTESSVFWPLRDEILQVAHRTGEITRRIPLRQAYGLQGGNLLVAGNYLIIARPDRLAALTDLTRPIDRSVPNSLPGPRRFPVSDNGQDSGSNEATNDASSASLWPVRRVWQRSINKDTIVSLPKDADEIVVQSQNHVSLVSGRTGDSLWSVNSARQLLWSGESHGRLLLGYPHELEARDPTSGQLIWRRFPNAGQFRAFRLQAGPTLSDASQIIIRSDQNVAAVDGDSGQIEWTWPPTGRRSTVVSTVAYGSPESWVPNRNSLLFRPENSHLYALLDVRRGIPVRHGALPLDLDRPIVFVPGTGRAIIGITEVNNVRLTRLAELGSEWTRPAAAKAHGAPCVQVSGEAIIVIEDGQFAIRRDRETGDALWKTSLGPRPLNDADRETRLTPLGLLAVSDGVLRSFAIDDGRPLWHRYLGSGRWQISLSGGVVLCRPDGADDGQAQRITICDLSTGQLLQRLSADLSGEANELLTGRDFCCVRSDASLTGFASFTQQVHR